MRIQMSPVAGVLGFLVATGFFLTPEVSRAQGAGSIYLSSEEIDELRNGTACKNLIRQFFALKRRMGSGGVATKYFDLKILPTDELVKDRKGSYYAVYLKDAEKSSRFTFPGGRYVIDSFDTTFRRSLSAFVREVLAVIDSGAEYDIYTRGGSSATPMARARTLVKGREYVRVVYLPEVVPGQYSGDATEIHDVPTDYSNDNLPFLRAAFLQDVVSQIYPVKQPLVLHSKVAESSDSSTQFAEIVLFVKW
ncbi:MAG: hypothetical protein K0U74_09315 [Alphaproteobacteria bacterium]|nr:hypothetical protein [Alphaproteobacteria bacterium]